MTDKNTEDKKVYAVLKPDIRKKLDALATKFETQNVTATVYACIGFAYEKKFPEYTLTNTRKPIKGDPTEAKRLAKLELAKNLGATIEAGKATWWFHNRVGSYKRSEPLAFLDDGMLASLYDPDLETVKRFNPNWSSGEFVKPNY